MTRRDPITLARTWMREPLARFVVLGAMLYAVDRIRGGGEPDAADPVASGSPVSAVDDTPIVIDEAQRERVREAYLARHGRVPTDAELEAAIAMWLDEELLYREGRALGLDRGDEDIRQRVIQRTRALLREAPGRVAIDDATLRAHFEAHRDAYTSPARFDLEHLLFAGSDDTTRARAEAAAVALAEGADPRAIEGAAPGGLQLRRRTLTSIANELDDEVARTVASLEVGRWSSPIASERGFHLVRIRDRSEPSTPSFESARERVRQGVQQVESERAIARELERLRARAVVERR